MPGDLSRRLLALEAHTPRSELFAVLVFVCGHCEGATSVGLCYTGNPGRTEHTTLAAYRARFGEQHRGIELWTIAGDAEPDAYRRCVHW